MIYYGKPTSSSATITFTTNATITFTTNSDSYSSSTYYYLPSDFFNIPCSDVNILCCPECGFVNYIGIGYDSCVCACGKMVCYRDGSSFAWKKNEQKKKYRWKKI